MISRLKNKVFRSFEVVILSIQKKIFSEVLVLGDSHAEIFELHKMRLSFPFFYFNVVSVGGATVSGLENPNSKTQAMPIFNKNLASSNAKTIIVILGEVDTGFVIWHRAEKYSKSIDEMLNQALANYRSFLQSLSVNYKVICISTPLPTITDDQYWGEVANARKSISASQQERTELTLKFNQEMKAFCIESHIDFIDLDSDSLGNNGIVDSKLINSDYTDHHYDLDAYKNILRPKLKDILM